ncbi:hypothetical protein RJT34_11521 [Clitoria ternatea]|uniref:Uncharacterized protein n=1 Tax=Clitoria ternatea TaxID=43366 RepID=A0AAN9JMT7_CLITE
MASKFSFLNSLMERSRNKPPPEDNNTFVKAAAWAWFQHNSGSKGETTTEFAATITHRAPKPSRYKIEAMRSVGKEEQKTSEGSKPIIHTKKLSLLDAYEVESISRHLNGLVESSKNHKNVVNNVGGGGANNSRNASVDIGVHKKKNRKGLIWLRHGAVCGREEDVVDPSALRNGSRKPTKQVHVNQVKCLPIANGSL